MRTSAKTHLGLLFVVTMCLIGIGSTLIANPYCYKPYHSGSPGQREGRPQYGKIVGMIYVGILESKHAAIKERIIFLLLLFSMSGMLLALTVLFHLARKMLQ